MSKSRFVLRSEWIFCYETNSLILDIGQVPLNRTDGLKQRDQLSDDIIIYDITDDIGDEEKGPVTPETSDDAATGAKYGI